MFENDATIGLKFDVQQSCRARQALSCDWRAILIPFNGFREKIKIKFVL